MPRPKRPGAPEPKSRSRKGCWNCKSRKVKCGEEQPVCANCQKTGEVCDYNIRLNWDGRRRKKNELPTLDNSAVLSLPRTASRPAEEAASGSLVTPGVLNWPRPAFGAPLSDADSPVPPTPSLSYSTAGHSEEGGGGVLTSPNDEVPPIGLPGRNSAGSSFYFVDAERQDAALRRSRSPNSSGYGGTGSFPPPKRLKHSADSWDIPGEARISSSAASPESVGQTAGAPLRMPSVPSFAPSASPLTPADSSFRRDGEFHPSSRKTNLLPSSPDPRRLTVKSLLSSPPGQSPMRRPGSDSSLTRSVPSLLPAGSHEPVTFYGFDRGCKDLDLGKNDDMNAISGSPAVFPRDGGNISPPADVQGGELPSEFGFGVQSNDNEQASGFYYSRPVPVNIPRSLEPLPSKLTENPMHLLYFQHFLNHTARVLVPHDDPQSNPFRTLLPQMAVKNENLLSLLLAYSASHRARLLKQPEPSLRIAQWVEDIFPALRSALDDHTARITNANLATAIMLASLEIISPTAFGFAIPWQKHLSLARGLVKARPGGLRRAAGSQEEDRVCSFLWSWFAYLDVLGSLSGGPADSSSDWILEGEMAEDGEDADQIDCIMGFTTRCVYILARIASLARACDAQRIGPDRTVVAGWRPSPDVEITAQKLEAETRSSLSKPTRPCQHAHAAYGLDTWDRREMAATNEAFHWAGLVHLHRRVFGKPSDHEDVRAAVQEIMRCLDCIRKGSTAEACLVFPMFTAGCDTPDEQQRQHILDRLLTVEKNGMTQVHNARRLMQLAWETNKSWETFLHNEFIG